MTLLTLFCIIFSRVTYQRYGHGYCIVSWTGWSLNYVLSALITAHISKISHLTAALSNCWLKRSILYYLQSSLDCSHQCSVSCLWLKPQGWNIFNAKKKRLLSLYSFVSWICSGLLQTVCFLIFKFNSSTQDFTL